MRTRWGGGGLRGAGGGQGAGKRCGYYSAVQCCWRATRHHFSQQRRGCIQSHHRCTPARPASCQPHAPTPVYPSPLHPLSPCVPLPLRPLQNQLYRHIIFRAHVTRLHRLAGAWQCFYDVEEPLPGGGGGGGGADGLGGGLGRSSMASAAGSPRAGGSGGGATGGEGAGAGGGGGGGGSMVVQHRMTADFVVVATGLHSTPAVPPIEVRQERKHTGGRCIRSKA